jgi:hypothetical protein
VVYREETSSREERIRVDYIPQTQEPKFILVPILKCAVGESLSIISESEKEFYGEIEKTVKKEYLTNCDRW